MLPFITTTFHMTSNIGMQDCYQAYQEVRRIGAIGYQAYHNIVVFHPRQSMHRVYFGLRMAIPFRWSNFKTKAGDRQSEPWSPAFPWSSSISWLNAFLRAPANRPSLINLLMRHACGSEWPCVHKVCLKLSSMPTGVHGDCFSGWLQEAFHELLQVRFFKSATSIYRQHI